MLIVNVREGQEIAIGDRVLSFLEVISPGVVLVQMDGDPEPFRLSWDRRLTILPDVQVTVENANSLRSKTKFLFSAPRSLRIRERPYEPST